MRRAAIAAVAAGAVLSASAGAVLSASAGAAQPAAPPRRPPALVAAVYRLPGLLLASAVAHDPEGRAGVVLLVADAGVPSPRPPGGGEVDRSLAPGRPRSLFFLRAGRSRVEALAGGLPERIDAVAALTPGDGGQDGGAGREGGVTGGAAGGDAGDVRDAGDGGGRRGDALLLGAPGILYVLESPWAGAAAARCRKVMAAPDLDLRSVRGEQAGTPSPRLPWVAVASAGKLTLLTGEGRWPQPRALRPLAGWPLPVSATREPWGLQLASAAVRLLPVPAAVQAPGELAAPALARAGAAGPSASEEVAASAPAVSPMRFAVGPEVQGEVRLRTLLLPAAAQQAPVEAWSLLPSAVQDTDSRYALWDGQPVLTVSAIPRLGIFVKRELWVFRLPRDRSRGGSPPAFTVHTDCHLWQPLRSYLIDLYGSGRQDLVLIHPEGLSGKKLRFQVHPHAGAGTLAAQPLVSTVDVAARDWFYGADLTGDGVADLLVRDKQGHLLLYPGVGRTGRVAEHPTWSFNLPQPPPAAGTGAGSGESRGRDAATDDGVEPAEGDDDAAAAAPPLPLAGLVALGEEGGATFLLSLPDGEGRTQIVAVRSPS